MTRNQKTSEIPMEECNVNCLYTKSKQEKELKKPITHLSVTPAQMREWRNLGNFFQKRDADKAEAAHHREKKK